MTQVPCPTCRGPSSLNRTNRWRPFCSERCRLVDLDGWLAERFVIAGEDAQDDASTDAEEAEQERADDA